MPHDCNWRRYGTYNPPEYPLKSIRTKLAIYSGGRDKLATPEDISILLRELPFEVVADAKYYESYGHLEFIVGKNAHREPYI